jgi:hypothetical protein
MLSFRKEVGFKDMINGTGTSKPGYNNLIRFCGEQDDFAIDTCCTIYCPTIYAPENDGSRHLLDVILFPYSVTFLFKNPCSTHSNNGKT